MNLSVEWLGAPSERKLRLVITHALSYWEQDFDELTPSYDRKSDFMGHTGKHVWSEFGTIVTLFELFPGAN